MLIPKRVGPGSHSLYLKTAGIVLSGVAPLICFWSVLSGGFLIWDDNVNLIENRPLWQSAGKAFQWMFTDIESVQRYKPLNWVAWRMIGESFAMSPVAFHALNLLVHAGNSLLLFYIVRKFLTTSLNQTTSAINTAALVGTLCWSLHPLRVEPVAWISGAGFPLATFPALLAILAFQCYLAGGHTRYYWISILFFGLSLLSHPAAAALPSLIFALAWISKPSTAIETMAQSRKLIRLILPYCALATTLLAVTLAVQLTPNEVWNQPPSLKIMGLGTRVMQAFAVWGWYLSKTLFPLHLAPVYPDFWVFSPTSFRAIANGIVIVTISTVLWRARRRFPEISAFWAAFLLLALPVLGLTEHPFSPADRYTYVPGLALALLLASALCRGFSTVRGPIIAVTTSVLVIGVFLAVTVHQLQIWRTPIAFFRCAILSVGFRPAAANLHWRLGLHYLSAELPTQAAQEFETVLRLDPGDSDAARYLKILESRTPASAAADSQKDASPATR